jgi:hypothetical protein
MRNKFLRGQKIFLLTGAENFHSEKFHATMPDSFNLYSLESTGAHPAPGSFLISAARPWPLSTWRQASAKYVRAAARGSR